MQAIISRAQAKGLGMNHYYTGKPCKAGHVDLRFVSTGGCMECGRLRTMSKYKHTTSKRRAYWDQESFLRAAEKTERGFDYSRVIYAGAKTPVEIGCPEHGYFHQSPTNHMSGKGCPRCKAALQGDRSRSSVEVFVSSAQQVWGDRFDYSSTVYMGAHEKVEVQCPQHGVFQQTPSNHLAGRDGCTRCNHAKSSPEDEVATYLARFTTVVQRDRSLIAPKEIDIYLPEHNLAVEFCGMYWHSHKDIADERKNKNRHVEKHRLCAEKGIRLITLYESEWAERKPTVKRMLRNAVGAGRGRLMARKCVVGRPTPQEARAFYETYHPQGGGGAGEHYGLYWKGKLVACMRFAFGNNDRGAGANNRQWTLGRYATRISVAGAASRLFRAFVADKDPETVKSFSDNRWFGGGMYTQLGFCLDAEVPADYQVWSPKLGLRTKPSYQRRVLPARIKEHGADIVFDPSRDRRTEAEITYLMGARRIYDCGKKRWLWRRNK